MRIIRVLGSMTYAEEVTGCDPATRLVRPVDTPLNDHTEHDEAQEQMPGAGREPCETTTLGTQSRLVNVGQRTVKVITRKVRRRTGRAP
jgi:hypothetical protein